MKFGVKPEIHGILFTGPQDGHVALIASVDYDKGDEVDIGNGFFCWCRMKGNCLNFSVLKNCVFFQTPCVFKLRVIAFAHSVDESFDFRAISDRYASSTRELNLDSQASEKTEVFLHR